MARRHSIAPPRKNTDHRGLVATARGRAEDWDLGVGVVVPLDVESCLGRPIMDLEAWAVYATIAAYRSAGYREIRLSALARSAGLPKKAIEGALRRAGGQPLADGPDLSAKRLPKRVAFIYDLDDGLLRLHRTLEAWCSQKLYVLLPVAVVRVAPSAAALRLLIAVRGVAVRRGDNAIRSWSRAKLRKILGLPPAADVDTVLADALPWVREHLGPDHHVAIERDDGWLRVAAGPAEHKSARLLADGFDPLAYQARYAARDRLRKLTVFDGPADGKRMALPGLWVHRAADYLAQVGAPIAAEQLRDQWLVHAHAARQRVSTPFAIEADFSGGIRTAFSAFVCAIARLAAEGKAWSLDSAELELVEAARLRRWLLRDGSTGRVHAWNADGRVMTSAMWRKHFETFSSARLRSEETALWHVGQPLPPDLPMPAVGTGMLVEADLFVPASPMPRRTRFERVDAADIRRALASMVNEESGDMDRTFVRLSAAYARDLADAPSRLLKEALRSGHQPHQGLAQLVLEGSSRFTENVSELWQDAANAMAYEGHGEDHQDVLRRASSLLGEALRLAQEAVMDEKAERSTLREEMLSRHLAQVTPPPATAAVEETPAEKPAHVSEAPRPLLPIRRPFAASPTRKTSAPVPAVEAVATEAKVETVGSPAKGSLAAGETLIRLREALASLPQGRIYEDPGRDLASCYLPALAAELETDGHIAENLRFRLLIGLDELVDDLRRPDGVERADFEAAVTATTEVLQDIGYSPDRLRSPLAFIVARQLTSALEAFAHRLALGDAATANGRACPPPPASSGRLRR
ncbi:hypothetical protein ABMY26_33335 [Azospirillum sp. HJ39]|uniref:hypothetical protein n=1 Tax=Azospirillum sp. HJ39 TaxID=3159496 RepID=UPI003557FBB3